MNSQELYREMKKSFDFTPVIETAVTETGYLTKERSAELMDALLQWFSVIPNGDEGKALQMLKSVDRLWHAFILNTKLYREFCEQCFGYYIDHDPVEAANPDLPRKEYGAYTLRLLENGFGAELNPVLRELSEDVTCCYWKITEEAGSETCVRSSITTHFRFSKN